MARPPVEATLETVRRLAVTQQRLAGATPKRPSEDDLLSVVRDLAYVQWDPVPIVAPSHVLSFWARLGDFRPDDLERLLWTEHRLLLHWIPIASIVSVEDYPIYASLMRRYPDSMSPSWGAQRAHARQFLARHVELRRKVLRALSGGPLRTNQFEEHLQTRRDDGEWTPRSDLAQMLSHLEMKGEVMVVGHDGAQNLWGRAEQFLPSSADRVALPAAEMERQAAVRAIGALGTATPREITLHWIRGRYLHLASALRELEADGAIRRVRVAELGPRDERYMLEADVPKLTELQRDGWEPRLSLLPPFDNLVSSTGRLETLFGFHYVRSQFLPKEKRKFGTYVLPILWGERFVGQLDPRMDRESGTLEIQAVHAEPGVPPDPSVGPALEEAIARLAHFLGAEHVRYPARLPSIWKGALG